MTSLQQLESLAIFFISPPTPKISDSPVFHLRVLRILVKKWTKFNLVFDQFLVYFAVAVFKLKKMGNESLKPSKIGGIKAVSVTWKHTHL